MKYYGEIDSLENLLSTPAPHLAKKKRTRLVYPGCVPTSSRFWIAAAHRHSLLFPIHSNSSFLVYSPNILQRVKRRVVHQFAEH